ncbi:UMP kinase [Haliangium ochraceum]|uniref:Uridylate kinase n=1 Tax=Haliangium ochraceum (strain DSM 14365 / JCM 11303 / SMP-2) TaxID=502025 RepID=D0LL98_HALO1|nr:UMP kinase [Haliangium ochraceum]ACY18594.1 uridylate kinase [Haliangium ochraceum DSM 14365]
MTTNRYRRVLVKLSGRAVAGTDEFGFNVDAIDHLAREILALHDLGVQISIMIGGGNIFRGTIADAWGINRAEADNIGVLGTVMNSLLLRGVLTARSKAEVRVMSALRMESVAEPFIRLRAIRHLEKNYIVVFGAGIGQPYVSTDYPSVQRALETQADALLVAKHGTDGIYERDPKNHPEARRYRSLAYEDSLRSDIRIMDTAALVLARDFSLPLHVFDVDAPGVMTGILRGENYGTFVGPGATTEFYPSKA